MSQFPEQAGAIFEAAIELPDEQRGAFVDKACAGDVPLRRRVETLLRAHKEAESFMSSPALGLLPKMETLSTPNQAGERIGRYKLLQQLGEGACGVVYMAEQDEPVRRMVALKIIKLGMDTKNVVARFEAERQALALMEHPHIAKVFDAGATETGRPYFVMELVKGIPINLYCDNHRLDTQQRLRLFLQICRAIQHAHQKGIIHRDIKPSNILVANHDGAAVPKIIDFGIAKATGDQRLTDKTVFTAVEQFVGTPAYMSPEQAKLSGVDIDTRSDIYSLGVLLYELLTGRTPFESKRLIEAGLDEVRRIIQQEEPTPPSTRLGKMAEVDLAAAARQRSTDTPKLIQSVRGDLDWIVMKALEKDRTRRYESANGLAMDIDRHLNGEPVLARPASTAYRFQKAVRRHRLAFAAGCAVLAALITGLGISTFSVIQLRRSGRALQSAYDAQKKETDLRRKMQGRAEAAEIQAKTTLATSDFLEANRLIEADNGPDAVAYLLRILRTDPANRAALTRLATLMTYHAWLVPVLNLKHETWVSSVEFSADGKLVLTSTGGPLRLWDAQTGQRVLHPPKPVTQVPSTQYSPDGTRFVTVSNDNAARVWDVATGRMITEYLRHESAVLSARFSPDGKRVVTASLDNTARVWDAQTGQSLIEPLQHGGGVITAQFSPDGRRIVTGGMDNIARVWDAETGPPVNETLRHASSVRSAKFSPDGKWIVTASEDCTAQVWNALTCQRVGAPMRHKGPVFLAQFSPDGQRIATASEDGAARVWEARTGRPLTEPLQRDDPVYYVQFSPDGKWIATASGRCALVWNAQTGQLRCKPMPHEGNLASVQFSPDGRRIVTADFEKTARLWDAETGQMLLDPIQHKDPVAFAQFSADGTRIVTASADTTARIWDAQTGRPLTEPLQHGDYVLSVQFSLDGTRVVTASRDRTARVWNAQTGRPMTDFLKHRGSVNSAQFSRDGQCVVTASTDNTVRVWDAWTGEPLSDRLRQGGSLNSAEFSPDGRRVVTACREDRTAQVWDVVLAPSICPGWLFDLAEALSGKRLNEQGILETTVLNRPATIDQVRQRLSQLPANQDGVQWGRWLLADRQGRAISPCASVRVPEYVARLIDEGTDQSILEGEELASGNTELSERTSQTVAQFYRMTSLESEADKLATAGKLAEAEAKWRKVLQFKREFWTNQPSKWDINVFKVMDTLTREGNPAGAEQVLKEILTPELESQPQCGPLLTKRGHLRAHQGRWREAAADFSKTISYDLSDPHSFHCLLPLLAQTGDLDGYRRYGAKVLTLFGATDDPDAASSLAKDCLFLPVAGVDVAGFTRLADSAVNNNDGDEHSSYHAFAKGLAEYRQGHFAGAVDWTQKALAGQGADFLKAQISLVMAMAFHQSGRLEESRAALAKGTGIVENRMPKLASGDMGETWNDWIITHALLKEAKALIEPAQPTGK